ncbi:[protein-PII] uridylyltransferase family protein [Maridesulfovibrio frigidus]|uniref:[protein-PII] uridylyltransferase family protein n=1 Tax=Maridesulfovibrio frigidus TaxID=340956 RepID=UPI0004E1F0BF|nr:ACT domain-containing protein [Maridesulfovibrio frigidus]
MTSLSGPLTSVESLHAGREILLAACSKSMPQDFSQRMSLLVDEYFRARLEEAIGEGLLPGFAGISVVAVGGYGRGKLSPFSDLDVLLLIDSPKKLNLEDLAAFLFHPLWDLKFEVGHGVRSVQQNIKLAKDDFKVLGSLLDLRFVAGSEIPFETLAVKFKEKVIPAAGDSFCKTIWDNRSAIGVGMDSVVLEPDLKNGWGTLRDVQFVHWCASIKGNYFPLSDDDLENLLKDEALLIRVRSALHLVSGRKVDRLDIERLADVASLCGVKGYSPAKRGQDLLNELHAAMVRVRSLGNSLYRETFLRDSLNFISSDGLVTLKSALNLFEIKSHSGDPLTRDTRRAVAALDDISDISISDALGSLVKIFKGPFGWRASLEMLDSGLIGSFIPAFSKLAALVPYDGYHKYPPGRHSLLTVHKCCDIFREEFESPDNLEDKFNDKFLTDADLDILVLAAFFHDIGKGGREHSERGAEITAKILSQTNFPSEFNEDILFLIRSHLVLVKAARRIDLSDVDSLLEIGRKVGTPRRLRLLFILSMADSMATGPRVWNSWSESLLRELYNGLNHVLTEGDLLEVDSSLKIATTLEKVKALASDVLGEELIDTMLSAMPDRYILNEEPDEIVSHMQLVRRFNGAYEKDLIRKPSGKGGKGLNIVDVAEIEDGRTRLVIISRDQNFLFASQTGVLALHSINILSAEIFSWSDGTAVNIFTVKTPPAESIPEDLWARVERSIMYAMTGRLSLDYRLHKKRNSLFAKSNSAKVSTQISVDNDSSESYTIFEVKTQDRSGILYDIATTFSRMNIDLRMARISTTGNSVFDVFHVENSGWGKIEDREHVKELVGALEFAVSDS